MRDNDTTSGTSEPTPEHPDAPAPRPASEQRRLRKITAIVAAIVVIAFIAAGTAFWHVHRAAELQQAQSDCTKAYSELSGAKRRFSTQRSKITTTTATVQPTSVQDADTVRALATQLKEKEPKTPAPADCTSGAIKDADAATDGIRTAISWYSQHTASLKKAAAKVDASRNAKTLADLKAQLDTSLDTAQKLLASSDGQVADNATRDALSKAIDEAKQAAANSQKYNTDKSALDNAMNAVNASITAKQQADAAAAQAQQQAQQRSQQQAQTAQGNNYNGGGGGANGWNAAGNGNSGSSYWAGKTCRSVSDPVGSDTPTNLPLCHDQAYEDMMRPNPDLVWSCFDDSIGGDMDYLKSKGWTIDAAKADCKVRFGHE